MAASNRSPHISIDDLSAFLDGQLDDDEQITRIEQHLAVCQQCRDELQQLRSLSALLANLPEPELPRSFRLSPEDVRDASAPVPFAPWYVQHQSVFRVAAMAAVLLLAVVITVDLLPERNGTDEAMFTMDEPAVDVDSDEPRIAVNEEDSEAPAAPESQDAPEAAVEPDDEDAVDSDEPSVMTIPDEEAATEEQADGAGETAPADQDAALEEPSEADEVPEVAQPDERTADDPADTVLMAEPAAEDSISTLRLIAIGLAVIAVALLIVGFVLPRRWSASARHS
jgi:hypothetical protein